MAVMASSGVVCMGGSSRMGALWVAMGSDGQQWAAVCGVLLQRCRDCRDAKVFHSSVRPCVPAALR